MVLGFPALVIAADFSEEESRVYGVGISVNDPGSAPALAKLFGANIVRVDAPWSQIEVTPGRYVIPDWLERTVSSMNRAGVEPLLILAYGNRLYDAGDKPTSASALQAFSRYASFVAQHFRGKVRYYDLWNEWDAHTGRTTPLGADEYVNLAKHVYPALKRVDPGIKVLSGGISDKGIREGFFERFFHLDGHQYVDALSIHPYVWTGRDRRTPEGAIDLVDRVVRVARRATGGSTPPIYITELGWPTHTGRFSVTETEASWFLIRFFLLASSRDYVKGVLWYCLIDQGNDPTNKEHRFGVLDRLQTARPAALALKRTTEILGRGSQVSIHREGLKTIAEIRRSGEILGRFVWEETPAAVSVGADVRSESVLLGSDETSKSDPRAPQWYPATQDGSLR